MIKQSVEKFAFDYGKDIMSRAAKLAKHSPEKAAEMMKNNGCSDLIEKMNCIPDGIKAKFADSAKLENLDVVKVAEKIPSSGMKKVIVGSVVVAGLAVSGYFMHKNSKNNTDDKQDD